ncbi:MAG: glycosyltransferase family 2 protein [Euryarchaeota archaeon]|nr:glycosyltransferase family 2 protein [Euryarchaeota archaeon]
MSRKIAVAVVNWKRAADTLECLASLMNHSYYDLELIVVDNGSEDGSVEKIAEHFPQVRLIALERNEGYVVGINTAIKEALKNDPEFVLIMNNDAVSTPYFLKPLIDIMDRRPQCGVAGPKILYYDSDLIWFGGGAYNKWLGYTKHQGMDRADIEDVERQVDYITGCAALIRSEVFQHIGLYDEEFTIYFEDLDLGLRAEAAGYESWYVPSSIVRHKVSASAGMIGENVLTPMRAYYYARNALLVIGKNRKGIQATTSIMGQYLVAMPYYSLGILLGPIKRSIFSYIRGLWEGTLWLINHNG